MFEEHLFTEEQCAAKIAEVLDAFARGVEDIEGQMLKELKSDSHDLPFAQSVDLDAVQKRMSEESKSAILQDSTILSMLALKREVKLEVLHLIVSELLAQIIANRLPVIMTVKSGTRLGSMLGKGTGWIPTSGLGILIEYYLELLVRQVYDPTKEMKKAINEVIDALQERIVTGGTEQESGTFKKGLDQEMRDFISLRSKIRQQLILEELGVKP